MNPENFDQPTFAEILQGYEAEVARLTAELAENEGVIAVWRRRTKEAEAELAAARENEARYLWLREGGFNLPDLPYKRQSGEESVAEIEAAIDAERLAPEEEDDD